MPDFLECFLHLISGLSPLESSLTSLDAFQSYLMVPLFKKMIYLFMTAGAFVAASRLSLVAESGAHSELQCMDFSLWWLLLLCLNLGPWLNP